MVKGLDCEPMLKHVSLPRCALAKPEVTNAKGALHFSCCAPFWCPSQIVTKRLRVSWSAICDTDNGIIANGDALIFMNQPQTTALRLKRRSAGLTQDDIARILGVGGRSYVAMLEAGDRVPHVRDAMILSLLFGEKEANIFPHLYSITRERFRSNVTLALKEAMAEKQPDPNRLVFLRDALKAVELDGNIEPQRV
jgi:transcriptional regulator with XRE-family HTH domain